MTQQIARVAFLVVLLIGMTERLKGDVLVPSGLAPGSHYQLMFVTSIPTNAESSDITYYNNFVQSAANAAGIGNSLGITWTAVASTDSVNASSNAPSLYPVFGVDGNLITRNSLYSTLTLPLTNLPVIDEYGQNIQTTVSTNPNAGFVYTGSNAYGTTALNLGGNHVSAAVGTYWGEASVGQLYGPPFDIYQQVPSVGWLTSEAYPYNPGLGFFTGGTYTTSVPLSLYALSSPLVVPGSSTPEPATLILLGPGLMVVGCLPLVGRTRAAKRAAIAQSSVPLSPNCRNY